jgi:hypothetical protein
MAKMSPLRRRMIYDMKRARSNCQTLFDIPRIPTDYQIRDMLDPAKPELLYPIFAEPCSKAVCARRVTALQDCDRGRSFLSQCTAEAGREAWLFDRCKGQTGIRRRYVGALLGDQCGRILALLDVQSRRRQTSGAATVRARLQPGAVDSCRFGLGASECLC